MQVNRHSNLRFQGVFFCPLYVNRSTPFTHRDVAQSLVNDLERELHTCQSLEENAQTLYCVPLPPEEGLAVACLDKEDKKVERMLSQYYQAVSIQLPLGQKLTHYQPFPMKTQADLDKAKQVLAHRNYQKYPEIFPQPHYPNPLFDEALQHPEKPRSMIGRLLNALIGV